MRRHLGRATALGVAARRRKAGNQPLIRTLQELGVATNLELCLDAGDYASYTGTGQTWADTSGAGTTFFLGSDGTVQTSDPTFNGTAGALTSGEYWSFDGGDAFLVNGSNPSWINALHQDNATYTFMCWVYLGTLASNSGLFGNHGLNQTHEGIRWNIQTTGRARLAVVNGSGSTYGLVEDASGAGVTGAAAVWNCYAISVDEAGGDSGSFHFLNGSTETFDAAYTTPGTGNATNASVIGAGAFLNLPMASGSRLAKFSTWSRALTAAELSDIYTKTRTRFGV